MAGKKLGIEGRVARMKRSLFVVNLRRKESYWGEDGKQIMMHKMGRLSFLPLMKLAFPG
jgi:hypothetical protein